MNKRKKAVIISIASVSLIFITLFLLFYSGTIWFNNPSTDAYPVRGVDVSSHQGEIDWPVLADQDIQFAYIKATEGSSFVDKKFHFNWDNARQTALKVGAYHFFSYDSSGSTQADNFINTVPKTSDMLPPVIDIEFYGDKEKNPPKTENVQKELSVMLDKLETHYGVKPVIYATGKSYSLYISGDYDEYDIWIRNVYTKPSLQDDRSWIIWQYSHKEKLQGYNGTEKFIDMNVFNGTQEEFLRWSDGE